MRLVPEKLRRAFLSSSGIDNGCREFRALGAQLHVSYSSTQLDFAIAFLKSHPQARLVTVGLGGDDVLLLNIACSGDLTCIQTGLATVTANMETILSDLRGTGFAGTIIVVNYYSTDYSDPIQTGVITLLNQALAVAAAQQGAAIADVFSAFQSETGGGNTCTFGLLNGSFSSTNEFTCDIHPSQSGQMLIGKVVAQTFAGAKRGTK